MSEVVRFDEALRFLNRPLGIDFFTVRRSNLHKLKLHLAQAEESFDITGLLLAIFLRRQAADQFQNDVVELVTSRAKLRNSYRGTISPMG